MHPIVPYAVAMAAFLTGLLAAERARWTLGKWLWKPLAALTFVAAALALGATETRYGVVLLVGLVFCVGGDVLLIPRDDRAFLGGLASFLLGHVAYAAAFLVRGVDVGATLGGAGACAAAAFVVGRWLLPHVRGRMRGPVLAYMVVISVMVALSVGTVARHGGPALFVGAFAFYLSDLTVARERFVAPGLVNRVVGLPLYFGAQLVLASTVAA